MYRDGACNNDDDDDDESSSSSSCSTKTPNPWCSLPLVTWPRYETPPRVREKHRQDAGRRRVLRRRTTARVVARLARLGSTSDPTHHDDAATRTTPTPTTAPHIFFLKSILGGWGGGVSNAQTEREANSWCFLCGINKNKGDARNRKTGLGHFWPKNGSPL